MFKNQLMKAVLWLFCIASIQTSFAQDDGAAQQFSLEECIEFALQNAVPVKNAILDTRTANASVNEIKADGLPQVNGEVQVTDNFKLQNTFLPATFLGGENANPDSLIAVPFGVRFTGGANLTLRQLIFDGTFFLGLRAAKTYKEMAKKNLKRTKIETVEAITKAYYGALISEARMQLAEENLSRLDTLFKQNTAMYENGFTEKIDVDRIRVNLNNAKTQLANLSQMQQLSMVLLKFQMGMQVQEKIKLSGKIEDIELPSLLSIENQVNYADRIEYSINKTQQEIDQLNTKRYKVGYYPKLYAFTTLGANSGANGFGELANIGEDWFSYSFYGFTLSVPIFDGFRKKHQIEQARIELQKSENLSMQLVSMIDMEHAQSRINLESNLNILRSEAENQELAEEIYRISNTKYQEGVGSSFELVDAETAFTNAQTNYYNALYNALVAKVDYLKAMGKLYNE